MKAVQLLMLLGLPLLASSSILEQKFYLTIDNQKFELATNKTNTIKIDNKEHNATITMAPLATFNHPNIAFKFPSSLNFSYDASDEAQGLKSWSINGDNLIIMVLVYNKKYPKETLINTLLSEYKRMKATIKEDKATLQLKNGQKIEGKKMEIYLGNVTLYQEIYILYTKNGSSIAFLLQDTFNDNSNTQEFKNAKEILKNSLVLKGVEGV